MSVICKNDFDKQYRAFVKGSPEKIYELCNSASIPTNFLQALEQYTKEGYRVIALATKQLSGVTTYRKAQTIKRE
jgi:magnesium-transporting ATPase (P-type)